MLVWLGPGGTNWPLLDKIYPKKKGKIPKVFDYMPMRRCAINMYEAPLAVEDDSGRGRHRA